jgi:phospholipase/lecithinase/hemolysin
MFRPLVDRGTPPRTLRGPLAALAWVALALLAGCEGGTPLTPFAPNRVLAFGDEASVIDSAGRKYTVNALNATTGALDCAANPLWIQVLATTRFGLVFPDCNPGGVLNPTSRILAAPGARVADVATQIDTQLAQGPLNAKDLVTVYVGQHDVLDLYGQLSTSTVDALLATAEARGEALGAQVNRLANAGARVLVVTVMDLGLTPFGRAEKAANTDLDRAALLTTLADRFNSGLRTSLLNDGRRIGIVLADVLVRNVVRLPAANGFVNAINAACATAAVLPDCNGNTLGAADAAGNAASATTWFWADDRQPSPGGHVLLGTAAANRASNNPFGS